MVVPEYHQDPQACDEQKVKDFYKQFPSIFPPGERFPDFELQDIHGNPHRLSGYFGKKYILITTGAIT